MTRPDGIVERLVALSEPLTRTGSCLSGSAGAHAHLAAATHSQIDEPVRYIALAPRVWEVVARGDGSLEPCAAKLGVQVSQGAVEEVVRTSWPLFVTNVQLAGGASVPVLTKEAVLAVLLGRGGLSIGLAGILCRGAGDGIDPDDVRELLKAARLAERFQPMLELLDVA